MLRRSIVTLVLCTTLAIAAFTGRASASSGAFVVNHGNNPGDSCNATAFGGYYLGFVTLVATPSGNSHFGCVTSIVSGTPVSATTMVNSNGEMLLATPGGQLVISFNS